MLYILGMIGKGIGITLLCVLALLAVLLFSVLFVPVRYRIQGDREEGKPPEGEARVCWLFSFVSFTVRWKDRLHYRLRICGIPVYDNIKKKKKEEEQKKKSAKDKPEKSVRKKKKRKTAEKQAQETEKTAGTAMPEPVSDSEWEIRTTDRESPQSGTEEQKAGAEGDSKKASRRQKTGVKERAAAFRQKILSFFRMLSGIIQKILNIPRKICVTAEQIGEKAEQIIEKAEDWMVFLQGDEFRQAFALCRKQLLFLWKSIRPGKVRADIRFGAADPAVTGKILSFAGMIYPLFGKNVILRPDFEEAVWCGKVRIKGRIILFNILRAVCALYFNKNIKRLIRIWKKEEMIHGRQ